jgi:tRNA pseudouridine13 synthase
MQAAHSLRSRVRLERVLPRGTRIWRELNGFLTGKPGAAVSANGKGQLEQPILKIFPQDFLVSESLVLPSCHTPEAAQYSYFKMTKSGFTTFQAVEDLTRHFNLTHQQISFAGLKDEDAVTEQMIAIEGRVSPASLDLFNGQYADGSQDFIRLSPYGIGDERISIGELNGNGFRVVVRNLSAEFAERCFGSRRFMFHFLNYYDTQRFGVPQGAKVSHLVGGALLQEDYVTALAVLRRAGTPESQKALTFVGEPKAFFDGLNPRLVSFFKTSHTSFAWNKTLAGVVRQVCGDDCYTLQSEGIPFLLTRKQPLILSILRQQCALDHTKFYGETDGSKGTPEPRPTVVQTQMRCNSVEEDDLHSGAFKCQFSFFLPSGCYATMCIKQLVNMADLKR